MKLFVVLLLAAVAIAEPQGYRLRFSQRQEEAPYAPSGYRPAGAQFRLPEKQQNAPSASYGPPEETTTTEMPTTTESDTITIEPEAGKLKNGEKNGKLEESDDVEEVEGTQQQQDQQQPKQEGVYYILLPTGQLQRVQYVTSNDAVNMAFTTQLRYQNVQPITDPIYAFNPNGNILQLVQQ